MEYAPQPLPWWCLLCHVLLRFLAHVKFNVGQGACVKKLSGNAKLEDSRATKQIVALLSAPLEKYSNIVTALELSNYPRVMDYLDNSTTKVMALVIIQSIMKNTTCISTSDKVTFWHHIFAYCLVNYYGNHHVILDIIILQIEALFDLIKGLIKDMDGAQNDEVIYTLHSTIFFGLLYCFCCCSTESAHTIFYFLIKFTCYIA